MAPPFPRDGEDSARSSDPSSSSESSLRVLYISLEYSEPHLFSGNGVYSRAFVANLSKLSKCRVHVLCGRPASEAKSSPVLTKTTAGSGSVPPLAAFASASVGASTAQASSTILDIKSKDSYVERGARLGDTEVTVLTVPLPTWYKLDKSSSWQEFGENSKRWASEIASYRPDVIMGVDWTSKAVLDALGSLDPTLKRTPFVYLCFRVFSSQQGLSTDDSSFYAVKEAETIQASVRTIALSLPDAKALEALSGMAIDPTLLAHVAPRTNIVVVPPPLRDEVKSSAGKMSVGGFFVLPWQNERDSRAVSASLAPTVHAPFASYWKDREDGAFEDDVFKRRNHNTSWKKWSSMAIAKPIVLPTAAAAASDASSSPLADSNLKPSTDSNEVQSISTTPPRGNRRLHQIALGSPSRTGLDEAFARLSPSLNGGAPSLVSTISPRPLKNARTSTSPFHLSSSDGSGFSFWHASSAAHQALVASPERRTFITCCARITPEKNILRFVEMVESCARGIRERGFIPYLVGPPVDTAYANKVYQRLKRAFPGDESVVLSDFVQPDKLQAIFARSVVNIHPALVEPFGMTIVEAAAFACPTVLDFSGHVGAVDVLPFKLGLSIGCDMSRARHSAATLRTYLRISSGPVLEYMGRRAREVVLYKLSPTIHANSLIEVLKDVLKHSFRAYTSTNSSSPGAEERRRFPPAEKRVLGSYGSSSLKEEVVFRGGPGTLSGSSNSSHPPLDGPVSEAGVAGSNLAKQQNARFPLIARLMRTSWSGHEESIPASSPIVKVEASSEKDAGPWADLLVWVSEQIAQQDDVEDGVVMSVDLACVKLALDQLLDLPLAALSVAFVRPSALSVELTSEMMDWGASFLGKYPALGKIRYKLVPGRLSEIKFWSRFYGLVQESTLRLLSLSALPTLNVKPVEHSVTPVLTPPLHASPPPPSPSPALQLPSMVRLPDSVASNRASPMRLASLNPMQASGKGMVAPNSASDHAKRTIAAMERLIQRDENARGVGAIARAAGANQLLRAALSVVTCKQLVVLTGFPCVVVSDPKVESPQETDGPPGAVVLSKCANALGKRVVLLIESVNAGVLRASVEVVFKRAKVLLLQPQGRTTMTVGYGSQGQVLLEIFPTGSEFTAATEARLRELTREVEDADSHVVAIERAGPSADGSCKTMKGRVMGPDLLAPLHRLFQEVYLSSKSRTTCIGDGGNELGMGGAMETIKERVAHGPSIGCVVPAQTLLACSVSNWGAYALAAAVAVLGLERGYFSSGQEAVDRCMGSVEEMERTVQAAVDAGARDGVTQVKGAVTVDGLPLSKSMEVASALMRLVLEFANDDTRNT